MGIKKVGLKRHPRMAPNNLCLTLTWDDGGTDYWNYEDINDAVGKAVFKARDIGQETIEVDVSILADLLKTSV